MLAINNIEVVYDRVILVLKGVSIDVGEGRITKLLGANGGTFNNVTLDANSNVFLGGSGAFGSLLGIVNGFTDNGTVTLDDAKRVARRLYGGGMLVTVAGRPKGLTSSESSE